MAVQFDLKKLEIVGHPIALVESVMQASAIPNSRYNTNAGQFAISDTGVLIYAKGGIPPDERRSLLWVDRRGRETPVTAQQLPFALARISPDGRKIVYNTVGRE